MNDHSSSGTAATNNNGLSSSTGGTTNGGGGNGGPPQQLIWQAHQVDMWHDLCDGVLQDMYVVYSDSNLFIVGTSLGQNRVS